MNAPREETRRENEQALAAVEARPEVLLSEEEAHRFRERWEKVQIGFVDEPRRAVEEADTLVSESIQRLSQTFAEARSQLERDWSRDGDVSTEELRRALQRYRSFFDRLLSV